MNNKLIIFKKLFKNFLQNHNKDNRRTCFKITLAFFIKCILNDGEDFMIKFKSKYMQNLMERIIDWIRYILMQIYRFYLVKFTPNDDKTFRKYELIHCGVGKPLHIKVCNTPDESFIDMLLNECGLFLVEEYFRGSDIIYDITINKSK